KMESPPYGGQALRNKLLVSCGPLVVAPPLAGSLLAPLRCAGPFKIRISPCATRRSFRLPSRPHLSVLGHSLVVVGDAKHCAFRFRIGQLIGYATCFFSTLAPMLRIIKCGLGHRAKLSLNRGNRRVREDVSQ